MVDDVSRPEICIDGEAQVRKNIAPLGHSELQIRRGFEVSALVILTSGSHVFRLCETSTESCRWNGE